METNQDQLPRASVPWMRFASYASCSVSFGAMISALTRMEFWDASWIALAFFWSGVFCLEELRKEARLHHDEQS